ncbi:MAG: aromatic amino acid permease [Parcubacteria group bacterium Gr01-1014_2]|nr:MAG: aromatic amino acid permease [Parcubacteria group bacterium Gr01-1014_2]
MLFNPERRIFLYAVSILVGTIVGVGIFGIPFSFAKAGFLSGILFLVFVGFLSLAVNLIFGEVVLRTKEIHQFTGYAKIYLGKGAKILASFAWFLSIYGALLAYIIISGNFLFNIFISQFYENPLIYSIWFFIFVSLAVLAGLKTIVRFELFMVFFFILVVFLVFILGIPKIELQNLTTLFNQEFWFLPYGILLFAYAGFSAIPIQREVLKSKTGVLKKAILWGSLIPAVLYLIFTISIVGISGEATSPDVVSGLTDFFDYRIIFLVSIFGILAITTSFLALAFALVETFRLDYGFKRFNAWALTCFIPFFLFLFGVRNFIEVISLAGALAIGVEGVILVAMYKKAKKLGNREPEYSLNFHPWLLNMIMILFAIGAVYAILF